LTVDGLDRSVAIVGDLLSSDKAEGAARPAREPSQISIAK